MALSKAQINRLIEAVKKHVNWLVYVLGGEAALTPQEIEQLKKDKSLPTGFDVNLVENSYVLGMLRMLMKKSDFQGLTFEQLLEAVDRDLTPVEQLALQQAQFTAGVHLKRVGQDIADGAFDAVLAATNSVMNEASVRDLVRDEVAFGLLKRKNYMAVASDLSHNLKTDWRRDWRRVAETELHRSKVQGQVQAIVNKIDIYAYSEGPESRVSVVPAPDRCVDCHHHYLDSSGNPKVFTLAELVAAGSNGDEGVSHKRQDGKHVHWKTTLPPLHPRCGCNLVYLPPGYSWVDGSLRLTDKEAYKASIKKSLLSKGNGTSADQNSGKSYSPFKPQATPLGAAANEKAPAAPPSVPGVDSPGRTASGGRPAVNPGAATVPATSPPVSGMGQTQAGGDVVDCPLGMQRCQALGGTGRHHTNSQMYEEHSQMSMGSMSALGSDDNATPAAGAGAQQQQQAEQELAQTMAIAATWNHADHATAKTVEHLSVGEIAHLEPIHGSMSEVAKITIKGNGDGCLKPERAGRIDNPSTAPYVECAGIVAENTSHKREVGAYHHAASYGSDCVPVTTYRTHEGRESSCMAWVNDSVPLHDLKEGLSDEAIANYSHGTGENLRAGFNPVKYLIETSPDSENVKEQLCQVIVHDLMINNCDGHTGNFRVGKDQAGNPKIHAIDKGLAFGKGMHNVRSMPLALMKKAGYKVTIPRHLEKQMRARSFSDELRSVGNHVTKKEAAETFIRTKYLLHLQDTEGHIDAKHFINTEVQPRNPLKANFP